MIFISSLILIVALALIYAGLAVAFELFGVERTRHWLRAFPRRVTRGLIAFLKQLMQPAPTSRSVGGMVGVRVPPPPPPRALPSVEDARASPQFGAREAFQLIGAALILARLFGVFDAGDAEEAFGDSLSDGADELGGLGLPPNPGDQFVQTHLRNGQVVNGYFRTNADATELNNYSGPFGDAYRRANGRS